MNNNVTFVTMCSSIPAEPVKKCILNYAERPVQVIASCDSFQKLPIYEDNIFDLIEYRSRVAQYEDFFIFFIWIVILRIIDE